MLGGEEPGGAIEERVTGRAQGTAAIPIQALVVRDVPKKDKKAVSSGRPETEEGARRAGMRHVWLSPESAGGKPPGTVRV